jgi:tetratricopeptide (TPR) repeat protein
MPLEAAARFLKDWLIIIFASMARFLFSGVIVVCFVSELFSILPDAKSRRSLSDGDEAYRQGNFREAEFQYRRALQLKSSAKAQYNLGNSLFRQGRYQEAAENFRTAAIGFSTAARKARAWYNLGNACFRQQQYADAVVAYKSALKWQPKDTDTKRNLEIALRALQSRAASKPIPDPTPTEGGFGGQGDTLKTAKKIPSKIRSLNKTVMPLNKNEAAQLLKIMEQEELKVQQRLLKKSTPPSNSNKDW